MSPAYDCYCYVRGATTEVLARFASALPPNYLFASEGEDPRTADLMLERMESLRDSPDELLATLYWSRPRDSLHVGYSISISLVEEDGDVVVGCGVLEPDLASARRWLLEIGGAAAEIAVSLEVPPPSSYSEFLQMTRNDVSE